jgi:hypothetical protein
MINVFDLSVNKTFSSREMEVTDLNNFYLIGLECGIFSIGGLMLVLPDELRASICC